MSKKRKANHSAKQVAAGNISGLVLRLLRLRDEERVTPEEFQILYTDEGISHLRKMIAGLKSVSALPQSSEFLRQMFVGERIVLNPTDGARTIAQAEEVFEGYLDSNFTNWGLDQSAQPTPAIEATVFEMAAKSGTFAEIYGRSLGRPLDELCLTQHQIIDFCVKHQARLHQEGYGTFFLFKVGSEFFVAGVHVHSVGRLYAHVARFSSDRSWDAEGRRRFVFPQRTL